MKHFLIAFFAMTFLATMHQKAFSQSSDLKIYDGHGAQISSDTVVPANTYQIGVDLAENKMTGVKVSNTVWANQVCEGFNYKAAERLGMDPITPGMLVKMLKDTAHCKVKYLNVKKDLLYNSEIEPNTSNIVWVKMKEDVAAVPYIVYTSPYNGQQAVLAKLPCKNPQADLREAIPEEKLADNNDDIYYTPDKNDGISESSGDANAHADANAEAKVIVEYVPQGATNFQQYSQPCGCYQPYYPPPQQYCYTPSYNSGLFFGVQILFTFQWGGQTYNAYDPNDQVVQNIVNNYVTNNYIVNNYGTSDSTSTDTGGATNGNDGDDGGVVDNGGATNGTDGGAQNGNDGGGRKSDPNANQNGYTVETLESNPIAHNASGLTLSNQGSDLSSAVGSSVHNAQTLDANPIMSSVSGLDNHVATLSGNGNQTFNSGNNSVTTLDANPVALNTTGNPNYNGTNHIVTNLDPNPVAFNSTNPNVFDANHTNNGLTYNQQQSGNNYTASAENGTFYPTNYSQGVKTFSYNGQQLQTNQTQSQGQVLGYTATGTPVYANNTNAGNGSYQNYNPNYNIPIVNANNGNLATNGNLSSVPRGNISYVPQQNGNGQQYVQHVPQTNFALGNNNGLMNYQPSRNLTFQQAPKFNLSQLGSKTFQSGRGAF